MHTADTLPYRIHAVLEGHEAVNIPIEIRKDFDREGSAGSGDLDDHEDDTDRFTDRSHGIGQGIHEKGEGQAGQGAGQIEENGMQALDTDIEEGP